MFFVAEDLAGDSLIACPQRNQDAPGVMRRTDRADNGFLPSLHTLRLILNFLIIGHINFTLYKYRLTLRNHRHGTCIDFRLTGARCFNGTFDLRNQDLGVFLVQ